MAALTVSLPPAQYPPKKAAIAAKGLSLQGISTEIHDKALNELFSRHFVEWRIKA